MIATEAVWLHTIEDHGTLNSFWLFSSSALGSSSSSLVKSSSATVTQRTLDGKPVDIASA